MREMVLPWWTKKKEERRTIQVKQDDSAVYSISSALVKLLRQGLVPDFVHDRGEIQLCSPREPGNAVVGIYLYDMEENRENQISGMIGAGDSLYYPPAILRLHFMVTAYFQGDLRYRSEEEQRILGRVLQIFHDNPILESDGKGRIFQGQSRQMALEYENINMEEKNRIWSYLGTPGQLSLYYSVYPVILESLIRQPVTKVEEVLVQTRQEGGRR